MLTDTSTPKNYRDEANRLKELSSLQLLDTDPDPVFDNLVHLACAICDAPFAVISCVDRDRIWFKARVGVEESQVRRGSSFCSKTIEGAAPLVVADAFSDSRFLANELVQAPRGIRCYAGIPLILSSGYAIGSLAIMDQKARAISEQQLGSLHLLAGQVIALFEARLSQFHSRAQDKNRQVSEQRLDFALMAAEIGDWDMDLRSNVARRSLLHDRCFGYTESLPSWGYDTFLEHVHENDRARVDDCFRRAMAGEAAYDVEYRVLWPDQTLHWLWSKGRFYFDIHNTPERVSGIVVDITKRKQTEENLRTSESRWRFAIEGSGDGLWDWDIQNNQVFYSDRWKTMLGLNSNEGGTEPNTWISHLHPEDKERVLADVQSHLDNKTSQYVNEHRVSCKDGSIKWVLGRGLVIQRDEAGKALRMLGTNTDITQRKDIESSLLSSSTQLQLLEACVSRLNDIVLITEAEPFDHPGPRIVFVNDAFVRRTGFSREEVIGQTPRLLQGAKTQRKELDRIRAALQRWEPVRAELINYTKSGDEFWLELDIVPVANSTGWYTHWVSVERDISDRKLAEAALRESELRHRSMFESNPQPMWVYDSETLAFLSVNDATVVQYGYSREDLLKMSLRDIRPSEDLEKLHASVAVDLLSPVVTAQIWTHVRKDGSKIRVEISAHAIIFQGRSARLVLAHDITERLQSEARVHQLAFNDLLTGLPNRTHFLNYASQILLGDLSANKISAAVLLDLDNFKQINDHWGHRCGDELLKQAAIRIRHCLTNSDFFARLGGDEFIVVARDIGPNEADASRAAEQLCSELTATLSKGFYIDQRDHFTSASIGVVVFCEAETAVDELLSRADCAMYSAKAEGRNTFRFFDGKLQAELAAQADLESELRLTIQKEELHLVFQPQVDQLGRVVGAEALLRWTHPTRGSIPPSQFIPAAESSGFILQVGQWVLRAACQVLAAWQSNETTGGLTVAVNVSARQFHHPDFVSQVLAELDESGAPPALLKLELTESLLAQDLDGIVQKMNALKSLGITFSLDDFGTGYSSLAYLKRLPLDQLKIDQGFVRDILVDASDAAIVRTVIALGDRLGLNVIAEGVETEDQKEFLRSDGCYTYQGYLFSRPLKKEDFETFCAKKNCAVQAVI